MAESRAARKKEALVTKCEIALTSLSVSPQNMPSTSLAYDSLDSCCQDAPVGVLEERPFQNSTGLPKVRSPPACEENPAGEESWNAFCKSGCSTVEAMPKLFASPRWLNSGQDIDSEPISTLGSFKASSLYQSMQARIDALQLFPITVPENSVKTFNCEPPGNIGEKKEDIHYSWPLLESPVCSEDNSTTNVTASSRMSTGVRLRRLSTPSQPILQNSVQNECSGFSPRPPQAGTIGSTSSAELHSPERKQFSPSSINIKELMGQQGGNMLLPSLCIEKSKVTEFHPLTPSNLTQNEVKHSSAVATPRFAVSSQENLSAWNPQTNRNDNSFSVIVQFREALDAVILAFNKTGVMTALSLSEKYQLLDSSDPNQVAAFLFFVPGLDKQHIGKFLGGHKDFNTAVLQRFLHLFCFSDIDLVAAIRLLFSKFQPPGESQELLRIVNAFSIAFAEDNAFSGYAADEVALLTYAILMLHTDKHNTRVRRKMSKEEFVKLVPQSSQLDEKSSSLHCPAPKRLFQKKFLEAIYEDVTSAEFRIFLNDSDISYGKLSKQSDTLFGSHEESNAFQACPSEQDNLAKPPSSSTAVHKTQGDFSANLTSIETQLKHGVRFIKYCRNGTLKIRVVKLSQDGLRLFWTPAGASGPEKRYLERKRQSRFLWLRDIIDVTLGPKWSPTFLKSRPPLHRNASCCSIHSSSRTLDLCAPSSMPLPLEQWASAILVKSQLLRQAKNDAFSSLDISECVSLRNRAASPSAASLRLVLPHISRRAYFGLRSHKASRKNAQLTAKHIVSLGHEASSALLARSCSVLRRAQTIPPYWYGSRAKLINFELLNQKDGTIGSKVMSDIASSGFSLNSWNYEHNFQRNALESKGAMGSNEIRGRVAAYVDDVKLWMAQSASQPSQDILDDSSTSSVSPISSPESKKQEFFKGNVTEETSTIKVGQEESERLWSSLIIPNWASHWDTTSPLAASISPPDIINSTQRGFSFEKSNVPLFMQHLLPFNENEKPTLREPSSTPRQEKVMGDTVSPGSLHQPSKANVERLPPAVRARTTRHLVVLKKENCTESTSSAATSTSGNVTDRSFGESSHAPFSATRSGSRASAAVKDGCRENAGERQFVDCQSNRKSAPEYTGSLLTTCAEPSLSLSTQRLMSGIAQSVDGREKVGVSRGGCTAQQSPSSVLPVCFAARLEAVLRVATREPSSFSQLMTGNLRIGCTSAPELNHTPDVFDLIVRPQSQNNSEAFISGAPQSVQRMLCYWEPLYLDSLGIMASQCKKRPPITRLSVSHRWPTGAPKNASLLTEKNTGCCVLQTTDMKPPFPPIPLALSDITNYSTRLSRVSLPLLSLWWTGLPSVLRPALWLLALDGTAVPLERTTRLTESFLKRFVAENEDFPLSAGSSSNSFSSQVNKNGISSSFMTLVTRVVECVVCVRTSKTTLSRQPNKLFMGWFQIRQHEKSKNGSSRLSSIPRSAFCCASCSKFRELDEELATSSSLCAKPFCLERVNPLAPSFNVKDAGSKRRCHLKTSHAASRNSRSKELLATIRRSLARRRCGSAPPRTTAFQDQGKPAGSGTFLALSQCDASAYCGGVDHFRSTRRPGTVSWKLNTEEDHEQVKHPDLPPECCGTRRLWRCAVVHLCLSFSRHRRSYTDPFCSNIVHLAAVITAVTPSFPTALQLLNTIASTPLLPTFDLLCSRDPRSARRSFSRFQLFQALFCDRLPLLFNHFKALDLSPEFYIPQWFGRLFSGVIPFHCLIQLWDRICLGGEVVVFQVALGLLHYFELQLLTSSFKGCLRLLLPELNSSNCSICNTLEQQEHCFLDLPSLLFAKANHHGQQSGYLNFDATRFWRCVDRCAIDPLIVRMWMDAACRSQEAADLSALLAGQREHQERV